MEKNFLKFGLSTKEAKAVLEKHGENEIERKKELSFLRILLNQFKSPLIYILVFAGLITLFLGETTDSIVIFLAVFVNTVLGFFQETKAEKSLVALRSLIVPKAWVVRDGQEQQIEASQIVPGDLVVLKTGEKVPADGILLEAADLHLNEAILTGESMPVEKLQTHEIEKFEEKNQACMGTVIVSGRGRMLVKETGMDTKMGKIAGGLSETIEEETPLKQRIASFSKTLTVIFSLICILILVEGLLRGRQFLEMFELAVATAVAAIPEGLIISITVILTLGMQKLLKRKALVRKLVAAETLGGVTVICADKTGTLTKGKMKVVKSDFTDEKLGLKGVLLCNNLINPLEMAMWEWAKKTQSHKLKVRKWAEKLTEENKRLGEIPFSSKNKFIATLYKNELFVSGAPEKILSLSSLSQKEKDKWLGKLDEYTTSGLRVVSFAYKKGETAVDNFKRLKRLDLKSKDLGLTWLGLLAFEDPVRLEVKTALSACKKAGIKIKVITGDYKETAVAVMNKLEIVGEKLKGEEILEGFELSKMTDDELARRIDKIVLFARTNPEDKIRIVEALQKNNETVAMMGDGVNDALALKRADIGIVVGDASEVAKETADMVLLDSNFQTIVEAVNEGRAIFENIRKVVLYLLSDSFTEIILISVSIFLGLPAPIAAVQILWVNLIEDGLPGLALAFEPEEEGLMTEPPRDKKESILNKELKILIFIIGIFTDFILLGIFLFLLGRELELEVIRTVVFGGLAINSLFYVFSCKTLRANLWHEKIFSNKFLIISVLIGFLMLAGGIHLPFFNQLLDTRPLPFNYWLIILSLGIINLLAIESVKWLFIVKNKREVQQKQ